MELKQWKKQNESDTMKKKSIGGVDMIAILGACFFVIVAIVTFLIICETCLLI